MGQPCTRSPRLLHASSAPSQLPLARTAQRLKRQCSAPLAKIATFFQGFRILNSRHRTRPETANDTITRVSSDPLPFSSDQGLRQTPRDALWISGAMSHRCGTNGVQSGSAVPVKAAILTLRRAINFANNLQRDRESNTFRRCLCSSDSAHTYQPRRQSQTDISLAVRIRLPQESHGHHRNAICSRQRRASM